MRKKSLKPLKSSEDELELWLQFSIDYEAITSAKKQRYSHASHLMRKIKALSKTLH